MIRRYCDRCGAEIIKETHTDDYQKTCGGGFEKWLGEEA